MKRPSAAGHYPMGHEWFWNHGRYFVRTTCGCGKSFTCHDSSNTYDIEMEGKVADCFRAYHDRGFDNSKVKMPWNGVWEGSEYVVRFF